MNFALLSRMLGLNSLLIGVAMVFSLPFSLPALGQHTLKPAAGGFEYKGVISGSQSRLEILDRVDPPALAQ